MEWKKGPYTITDDPDKLDKERVCSMLQKTYWAEGRSNRKIMDSMDHSLCISLLYQGKQIGFIRIITDYTWFAWICDVIIDENFRGQGHGKWLMDYVTHYPALSQATMYLRTKDAHGFYEEFGFKPSDALRRGASV